MFTRKDVRTALNVLLLAASIGVSFEARPVFAAAKTKKEVSNPGRKANLTAAAQKPNTGQNEKISKVQNVSNTGAKNTAPRQYKVNAGDTLYRISVKHNVSLDELMRINNLKDNSIHTGMVLKIPADSAKQVTSAKPLAPVKPITGNTGESILFDWPVKKISSCKEDGFDGVKSIGIIISAPIGSFVHSSAQGIVEKVGAMRGYGKFVLVKHPGNYFTIYSYLENVKVRKGEAVNKGAIIGYVDSNKKSVHFQIDHNGKPVNPLDHLPKKR